MTEIRVGIVGYSKPCFNIEKAKDIISDAFDEVEREFPDDEIVIVSGLTDLGVPSLAYQEAVERGFKTVGIACIKAYENDCFPVDESIIEGEEWGDESVVFIKNIDVFIRIGGGPQSMKEEQMAREANIDVITYDL